MTCSHLQFCKIHFGFSPNNHENGQGSFSFKDGWRMNRNLIFLNRTEFPKRSLKATFVKINTDPPCESRALWSSTLSIPSLFSVHSHLCSHTQHFTECYHQIEFIKTIFFDGWQTAITARRGKQLAVSLMPVVENQCVDYTFTNHHSEQEKHDQ